MKITYTESKKGIFYPNLTFRQAQPIPSANMVGYILTISRSIGREHTQRP